MKAVMISIQPKWVEKIANKEKTIEVRKTRPKIKTPFKCYIYCTIGNGIKGDYLIPSNLQCGKVIGEFVCDWITEITPYCDIEDFVNQYIHGYPAILGENDCLSFQEMKAYLGNKKGYDWHISDLKIYDKPKELSEFKVWCENAYRHYGEWFCKDGYGSCAVRDKEKEFPYDDECIYFDCPSCGGENYQYEDYAYCLCCGLKPLKRPPQSWCYVKELQEKQK